MIHPTPILLGSEIYRRSSYGPRHPLAIPRVSATLDLIRAMGWLDEAHYRDSPKASLGALARFHDREYLDALLAAERDGRLAPELCDRFNIGRNFNPIFPEIFSRPATACGATLLAVGHLKRGGRAFSPAGGTHHGRPAAASGFCYLNDPALGILAFLDQGLARIAYVDLDAHHGDGVEAAFRNDHRVRTISIHEAGRWPGTGSEAGRTGPGESWNLPVPPGLNDTEHGALIEGAVVPLVVSFAPDALVVQCGADCLADDPMSGLLLSNRALWSALARLLELAPRLLVLGGGGYNPWSVARCWAGLWAVVAGLDPGSAPTPAVLQLLSGLTWNHRLGRQPPRPWLTTIADAPRPGPIRDGVADLVKHVERAHGDWNLARRRAIA